MHNRLLLLFILLSNSVIAQKLNSQLVLEAINLVNRDLIKKVIYRGQIQSNELDSQTLILLSGLAFKIKDFKNAGVFNYQGMLRLGVDTEIFPPKHKNKRNEIAKTLSFINEFSGLFNEYVFFNPDVLPSVIDPLSQWRPICDVNYIPGWKYEIEPDYDFCAKTFNEKLKLLILFINERGKLIQIPEYLELLRLIEGPNKNTELSQEEIEKIKSRMQTIQNTQHFSESKGSE